MTDVVATLEAALAIDGATAAALVDYESGTTLGRVGGAGVDLDVAAAGGTDVVRAQLRSLQRLGLPEDVEDVLVTLGSQLHLLRLVQSPTAHGLLLYLVLDREGSNVAAARRRLTLLERELAL